MPDLERYGPALAGAMEHVTDLVTVIDAAGNMEYVNPYGVELFGYASAEPLIGTPVLDHIHPDDLPRVITAMTRMLDVDQAVPGRPAVLRIRRGDGSYVQVEANGAAGYPDADGTSRMVVTARPTTDADLHELLMHLLTSGAPSEKSFELVPQFGAWRQPNLLHAVFVRDDEGVALAFGSDRLVALGGLDDDRALWADARRQGHELFNEVTELPADVGARARSHGITWVRARPVDDPLHRDRAVVVLAHDTSSPLPAERSTLEFSWYALDKMEAVLEMALAWRAQTVELRRAASTDPLTGLANRAGFWSGLERATGARDSVTVLYVDLDRFKPVNDSYGHSVGDGLLLEVAERLRHLVRPSDLVARLGGDEFAVVLHDLDDGQVTGIATRIVDSLAAPFEVGGHRVEIGASVGVARAGIDDFDADRLLEQADRALYDAKGAGRGRWVRAH